MEAKDFLYKYLEQRGEAAVIPQFEDFFKSWSGNEFDEQLLRTILANADLKHGLAKYIVDRIVHHGDYYLRQRSRG